MIKPSDKKALKRFGERLHMLREKRGLSLRELSYACNIDYSKISKIEKGQVNITVTTVLELSRGLDIEAAELFRFDYD